MSNETKNKQIAETFRETKMRRQTQQPIVIECKVKKHMLNRQQFECLKMIFVEAKWIYNFLLARSNEGSLSLFDIKMKDVTSVTHFNKDKETITEILKWTGSSMRDEILKGICTSIRALAKAREAGCKVGGLQFISEYTSINLKQYGTTHKITGKNRIRVQGIRKPLPVSGLRQLENLGLDYELANAKLMQRNGDYYVMLTVMVNRDEYRKLKESRQQSEKNPQLGIDFGCQTTFTLSTGEKISASFEETDRLKRLQRKLKRQKKGSNNRRRTILKIRKECRRITNHKDEMANQLAVKWLRENEEIIIQDEQIRSWKRRHGKKVQHSILGRVKEILVADKKRYPDRIYVLNRFVPTTKLCRDCGYVHKGISLWDRQFVCPECGVSYDRDVHAAENMVWIHNNIIGVDGTEFKREDFEEQIQSVFEGKASDNR